MNSTPNTTATAIPSSVPVKLSSSVEFSVTADRISTVSTPSRSTSRNTKKNSPAFETPAAPVYCETFSSIEPFMVRAVLCMNQIMLITKAAAPSITQPSNTSELNWVRASTTAPATLAGIAEPKAQKTVRFNSGLPILDKYANTMPTISDASTPSRSVMINACNIRSFSSPRDTGSSRVSGCGLDSTRVESTVVPQSSVLRTKLVVNSKLRLNSWCIH